MARRLCRYSKSVSNDVHKNKVNIKENSRGVVKSDQPIPFWPAPLTTAFFLALGIFFWPNILRNFISLTWRRGHMLPVAYACSAFCLAIAPIIFLRRNATNAYFHKVFPNRKE